MEQAVVAALLDEELDDQALKGGAMICGRLRSPTAVGALTKQLDASSSVRSAAAWALGEIGDQDAGPALTARLEVEEEIPVKVFIVEALGKLRYGAAASTIAAIAASEDADLRLRSIRALAQIGTPIAVEPLARALTDPSRLTALQAAQGLGSVGTTAALQAYEAAEPEVSRLVKRAFRNAYDGSTAHGSRPR
jgi:HEAT repeat protein